MLFNFIVTGHIGARIFVLYHGDDELQARAVLAAANDPQVEYARVPGQQRIKRKLWLCDGRAIEGIAGPFKLTKKGYAKR